MKINARRKLIKRKIPKDPTLTSGIFRQWQADIRRRFGDLKKTIYNHVVKQDIFGLKPLNSGILVLQENRIVLQPRHFVFSTDQERLEGFLDWLQGLIDGGILEVIEREGARVIGHSGWQNKYLRACYEKGVTDVSQTIASLYGLPFDPVGGIVSDQVGLAYHLRGPVHAPRVASLYSRSFHELKGITDAMSQQIGREIAQGLALGHNPEKIARNINDRVDKIGITRARLLARTETSYARNMGAVHHAELQEKYLDEEILFQWLTAGDDRVRKEHQKRSSRVFTKEEVAELVGEVNCRCSIMPYLDSVQGPIDPETRLPLDEGEWTAATLEEIQVEVES